MQSTKWGKWIALALALMLMVAPLCAKADAREALKEYGEKWVSGQLIPNGIKDKKQSEFAPYIPSPSYAQVYFPATRCAIAFTEEQAEEMGQPNDGDDMGPKAALALIRALGVDLPQDATYLTLDMLFSALEQILDVELNRPQGVDMDMPVGGSVANEAKVISSTLVATLMPQLAQLQWSSGELDVAALCTIALQACGALGCAIPYEIVQGGGSDYLAILDLPGDISDLTLNGQPLAGDRFPGSFGAVYHVAGTDSQGGMWTAFISAGADWFEELDAQPEGDAALRPCGHALTASGRHGRAACGKGGHYRCDGRNHGAAACGTHGHTRCDKKNHKLGDCGMHYNCAIGARRDHQLGDCGRHYNCDLSLGKNHQKAACGRHYNCDMGNGRDHLRAPCGRHYNCEGSMGSGGHLAAPCGVSGHFACDGFGHAGCHEQGMIYAPCGAHLVGTGGDHGRAGCGAAGHYLCDGLSHQAAPCGAAGHLACDGRVHSPAICNPVVIRKEPCGMHDLGAPGHHTLAICGARGHYTCDGNQHAPAHCYALGHCISDGLTHSLAACGLVGHCQLDGRDHGQAACGVPGHSVCDGLAHGTPACNVPGHCTADAVDHGPAACGAPGHAKCDGRYHEAIACPTHGSFCILDSAGHVPCGVIIQKSATPPHKPPKERVAKVDRIVDLG